MKSVRPPTPFTKLFRKKTFYFRIDGFPKFIYLWFVSLIGQISKIFLTLFLQSENFVSQDCDDDMLDDFFFTEADLKVLLQYLCCKQCLCICLTFSSLRPNREVFHCCAISLLFVNWLDLTSCKWF